MQLVKFVDADTAKVAALHAQLVNQVPQSSLAFVGTHKACTDAVQKLQQDMKVGLKLQLRDCLVI